MVYCKNVLFILGLILALDSYCTTQEINKDEPTPYHDWDYIVYSQRWPITACIDWQEEKEGNTCNLPDDKTMWTIHGLWPTKNGTKGPLFCPSAIHFDPNALEPIINELNSSWINIEANTKPNSFWKHEWAKHGTCASTLPQLDSILNYFQQGLVWNEQYKLSDILTQSKVIPGTEGYTIDQIYNAVKLSTQSTPIIQCTVDRKTKESMISEIQICFNKSLEVVDCDQFQTDNENKLGILTDCSLKKPVMYFAEIPNGVSYEMDYVDSAFKQHLDEHIYYLSIYRLLRFLIWYTT
ncbi:hypothetical protein NQ315_013427 [Exocentrus adspersus]|uniref:Uncharacterized protein n=1 Tax=Exocentrus adspersus TaxID=1586481 RepID=A0AAV8VHJ4_9CUCU|nr:hypothetical protein NQ315_013427 [Exocentrus adspersus]